MDLGDAIAKLRGDPGQEGDADGAAPASKELKDFPWSAPSSRWKHQGREDPGARDGGDFKIGYVRITQFNEPTAADLGKRLDELEARGMQALIIDLRYNPAGS